MLESLLTRILRSSSIGPALTRFYVCPRVKLHRIKQDDADFHTHPWNGVSFIFGSYRELRGDDPVERRRRYFNRVFAYVPHRVLVDRPVWTLFIHGRRVNEKWRYGDAEKPWEGSDQERAASHA